MARFSGIFQVKSTVFFIPALIALLFFSGMPAHAADGPVPLYNSRTDSKNKPSFSFLPRAAQDKNKSASNEERAFSSKKTQAASFAASNPIPYAVDFVAPNILSPAGKELRARNQ